MQAGLTSLFAAVVLQLGPNLLDFLRLQSWREVLEPSYHIVRPKVFLGALWMNKSRRLETTLDLLEVHESDAPCTLRDGLAAASTASPPCGSSFSAVETGKALVLEAPLRFGREPFTVIDGLRRVSCGVEIGLGVLVGAADQMKPQRQLTLDERIGQASAEAQLAFGDALLTTATPGPAARGGFNGMCHSASLPRCT